MQIALQYRPGNLSTVLIDSSTMFRRFGVVFNKHFLKWKFQTELQMFEC